MTVGMFQWVQLLQVSCLCVFVWPCLLQSEVSGCVCPYSKVAGRKAEGSKRKEIEEGGRGGGGKEDGVYT